MIFNLPDLGEGLAEAEIREWYVKQGDIVKVDQKLLSVETAKAVVDVPSPEAGKIVKLYGNKGDFIKTGAPLVEFEGDNGSVVGKLEASSHVLKEDNVIIGARKNENEFIKVLPAIRALAKQLNIDLNLVKPTGSHGEITEEDVRKSQGSDALHGVRRFMAEAMSYAHQEIAAVTLMDDANITHLSGNADITVAIFQALIHAIKKEPALNAWYDSKTKTRILQHDIHLGLAIDTEEGLFVPVLKDTHQKDAKALRSEIDVFKKSVRDRTVSPNDLKGATITISNFGMFAGRYATPMIVPPQVAILGCGQIRKEVKVVEDKMAICRVAPLSLTFDHRVVTGGEASRFLAAVIHYLESAHD